HLRTADLKSHARRPQRSTCPIDIGCGRIDPYDFDVRNEIDQGSTEGAGAAADVEHARPVSDAGKRGELRRETRTPAAHEAHRSRWIGVGHACTPRAPVPMREGREAN